MEVQTEKLNINGIEIPIIRSKRKSLAITVNVKGEVLVRAPLKLSQRVINEFAESKRLWIIKASQKSKEIGAFYNIPEENIKNLREKAKEFIPKRVEFYSALMNLKPSEVKINSAKTRFGSCSSKNSLNFSFYLMLYPKEAVDYVVVHELAHIKHKNHGKEFYRLIEKYMPDYKERIKMLKMGRT